MSNEELKKRLQKEILRTGYPLEIEIQSILEEQGWAVFPTHFYLDSQTHETRDIDILAFHEKTTFGKETEPIAFSPHLIIECKKSVDHALILFSRKLNAFTFYDFTGHIFDLPILLRETTKFPIPTKEFNLADLLIDSELHYKDIKKVSTHFPLLKPEGKEKSDIYEAVMQLVKAQSFEVKEAMKRSETIAHPYHPLFFNFLAVVFDGIILEATLEKGEIELNEVEHGLIRRSFQPDYEYFGGPLQYTIDVVKKQYFSSYLSKIEQDIFSLTKRIKSNIDVVSNYLKRREVGARVR